MNWEAIIAIVAVVQLINSVVVYALLSPMRELKKQVTTLTNAGFEKGIKKLETRVDNIERELIGKEALRAMDKKRGRQFGGMNGKIEILLQRTARFANHAQEAEYLAAIRAAEEAEDGTEI